MGHQKTLSNPGANIAVKPKITVSIDVTLVGTGSQGEQRAITDDYVVSANDDGTVTLTHKLEGGLPGIEAITLDPDALKQALQVLRPQPQGPTYR